MQECINPPLFNLMTDEDKTEYRILALVGVGAVLVMGIAAGHNYYRAKQYPMVQLGDSLDYLVSTYETNRGSLYVTFHNNLRYQIPNQQKIRLSERIAIGDVFFKRVNSDTITVQHQDSSYFFLLDPVDK